MDPVPARTRLPLAAFLAGAGASHFVAPSFYDGIVPHVLGRPRTYTYVSGVAELVTGALVAHPRTSRLGAKAAAALFVAVYPANIQHAVDHWPPRDAEGWGTLVRLPLQVPLVLWSRKVWATKAPSTPSPSPR